MSHMSMILSALFTMSLLVFLAPNIFALNRGHILRNIALWLAIFLGLALIYQNFGPGSAHPLFQLPEGMGGVRMTVPAENNTPPDTTPAKDSKGDKDDGQQGYTPPSE